MGEYMRVSEGERVHQVACSHWSPSMNKVCLNYAPPGIHLSWGNCLYTKAPGCVYTKWFSSDQQKRATKDAGIAWSEKFGATYMRAAEEIIHHGDCLRRRLANASRPLPSSCVRAGLASGPLRPHPDLMIYGSHAFVAGGWGAADFEHVMGRFTPDPPGMKACHVRPRPSCRGNPSARG